MVSTGMGVQQQNRSSTKQACNLAFRKPTGRWNCMRGDCDAEKPPGVPGVACPLLLNTMPGTCNWFPGVSDCIDAALDIRLPSLAIREIASRTTVGGEVAMPEAEFGAVRGVKVELLERPGGVFMQLPVPVVIESSTALWT